MRLVSTHCMPSAMLATLQSQPHLVLTEGPLSPARSSVERPLPEEPLEGLVRDGGRSAPPPEPPHHRERGWRPGPRPTLEVPDFMRQEGTTGFMGSPSQSSPASRPPPILMTKPSSENTLLPLSRTRQAEPGLQKERICGEVGQGGTERRQDNGTSPAMKH